MTGLLAPTAVVQLTTVLARAVTTMITPRVTIFSTIVTAPVRTVVMVALATRVAATPFVPGVALAA